MVKFVDLFIAGFILVAVMSATLIFVTDGLEGYSTTIEDSNSINATLINETLEQVDILSETLQSEESGPLDDLVNLFRKPIAVARLMGGITGILKGMFDSFFADYGIDPVFGRIVLGLLTVIVIFLFVAMLTGRFV